MTKHYKEWDSISEVKTLVLRVFRWLEYTSPSSGCYENTFMKNVLVTIEGLREKHPCYKSEDDELGIGEGKRNAPWDTLSFFNEYMKALFNHLQCRDSSEVDDGTASDFKMT